MLITDIQFKAITDHSTAEPLRTLHTAVDTETTVPYVAALVAGKVSVYSEQHKCSRTTPGTNWRKNLWCLGEVNNLIKNNYCCVTLILCDINFVLTGGDRDMKCTYLLYWFRGSWSKSLVSCVLMVTFC